MFPAYNRGRREVVKREVKEEEEDDDGIEIVDKDGEVLTKNQKRAKDLAERTRQVNFVKHYDKQVAVKKDAAVHRSVGYGSSDSDDDMLPSYEMASIDKAASAAVNSLIKRGTASKSSQMISNRKPQSTTQYGSFPHSKTAPKVEDDDDERRRSRKKEKRRRKHSRSSSRSSSRSKRKKHRKKKKKRYSSSSSRSRSSTPPRRRSPVRPTKSVKWGFTRKEDFERALTYMNNSFLETWRIGDYQNFVMGIPSKEKPSFHYNVHCVLGLNAVDAKDLYIADFKTTKKEQKREKSFHEKLRSFAKHPPRESNFRRKIWDRMSESGFVVLSKDPLKEIHVFSEERQRLEEEQNNAIMAELQTDSNGEQIKQVNVRQIADLQTRGEKMNVDLRNDPNNIELWVSFVDLQDKICEARRAVDSNVNLRRGFLERKEEILKSASKRNPACVLFHIMRIDVLIELQEDPELIVKELKTLTHSFPHEKMAWNRYLDYVQYNGQVYSYERMEAAFSLCMEKVRGLVEGTLKSHLAYIDDIPAFRQFQLCIYIRYLKWQMQAGFMTRAIANIQGTFEINFGFGAENNSRSYQEKMARLRSFWNTKMPRIGDTEAKGARLELQRMEEMSVELRNRLEFADYDISQYDMKNAVNHCLERSERSVATNFVEFERKMANIEARVKRNPVELYDSEYKDEFNEFETWKCIKSEDLKVYCHPSDERGFDFVQPILELLGMRFVTTTRMWSTTEDIIDEWRMDGKLDFEHDRVVTSVPTYTDKFCQKFSCNIVKYLLEHQYPIEEGTRPNDAGINLMAAFVISTAIDMEKNWELQDKQIWRITTKDLSNLMNTCFDSPVIQSTLDNKTATNIMAFVAVQKICNWHRSARQSVTAIVREIEKLDRRNEFTNLYVDGDDKKRIYLNLPKFVSKLLQTRLSPLWNVGDSSQWSSDLPVSSIQSQLLGLFLRLSTVPTTEAVLIRNLMTTQILEKGLTESDSDNKDLVGAALSDMYERLKKREETDKSSYAVLPSASAVCFCLLLVNEFSAVKNGGDKNLIGILCSEIMNITKLGIQEDEYAVRDAKLIIDTFIFYLSETRERKLTYFESFKIILKYAHQRFPTEISYAKRLVEENVSCTVKKIETDKVLSWMKLKNQEQRRLGFDMKRDTVGLVLALTSMYSSLRLLGKSQSTYPIQSLVKTYQVEASLVNDPSLWRMAIKMAAQIKDQSKSLDKIYTLANGQCGWAKNIHLDRVDEEPTEDVLIDVMQRMLEVTKRAPHSMYVADIDILQTYREAVVVDADSVEEHVENEDEVENVEPMEE